MKLDLDWELGLFHAVESGWNRLFGKKEEDAPGAVELASVKDPLTIVARALTGLPVEIRAAEDVGGRDGDIFLLPSKIAFHEGQEDNRQYYLFRIVFLSFAEFPSPGKGGLDLEERESVAGYRNSARVVRQFPSLQPWLQRTALRLLDDVEGLTPLQRSLLTLLADDGYPLIPEKLESSSFDEAIGVAREHALAFSQGSKVYRPLPLWGSLYAPRSQHDQTGAGDTAKGSFSTGTETKAPPKENVKVITVDEERWKKKPVAPPTGGVVESVEEYSGSDRMADGSDTMQEDAAAMQDLNLREVIRSSQETRSIFKSDLMLDASVGDAKDVIPAEPGIQYDEWDAKKNAYRKNWCTVYEKTATLSNPLYAPAVMVKYRKTAGQLSAKLARFQAVYRERPRYSDGAEIDLDAAIDMLATLQSGHTPSDRIYMRSVRAERDVALLVLLDLSLSTDGYVQNRRVLDVARESIVLLGETWDKEGDQLGIAGFYSNTRHSCQYTVIKDFKEPWARAKGRLGMLEPAGYTRIGPAVRHATSVLKKVHAGQKCLLVITDGKPNDYDRYEGSHGIHDVKQAVTEATQEGILVHALAIESTAKDYLPAMLGHRRYRILPRPEQLTDAVSDLLLQLKAKRA